MAMGTEKTGIRRQFLLLLFLAALLSFAALSAVLLHSMYRLHDNALESSREVGKAAGEFTESLAENHAKQKLLIDVTENAHHANQEIADIAENTEYIALTVGKILSNPGSYLPRTVKTAGVDVIKSGECYMLYGPHINQAGDWEDVAAESLVAANIADTLEHFSIYYSNYATSCFVASEKNYMLCAESFPEEELIFTEEFLESYTPTEREFYNYAKKAGSLSNRLYVDSSGYSAVMCTMPYYVNGKMAGIAGIGISVASLYHDITSKTVGTNGVNFAVNERGELVFSSEKEGLLAPSKEEADLRNSDNGALALAAYEMTEGKSGVVPVTLNGREYYLAYAPMPKFQWSLGSLALKSEVVSGVQEAKDDVLGLSQGLTDSISGFFMGTFREMAISIAVIFVVIFFLSQFAAGLMVRPLLTLTAGVDEIAQGNLDAKLKVRTGDELEELSDTVNQMTDELKLYIENLAQITEEQEKIQTELNLSRAIQVGMLPDFYPNFEGNPHYELFASMNAARQVGGDFYDFYMLDENHLALTVADVSGKGIPAALFMVISKTILKNTALAAGHSMGADNVDWGRVMERMNRHLCENNEEMMFVTVFFGVLDIRSGEFAYVNGGHNPPLIGRVRGETAQWEYIREEKKSHMVGVIETASYQGRHLTLSPGDMLYFYTDGVTEAMDEEKNLYTEERLQETLTEIGTPDVSVRDILTAIRGDVNIHAGGAEQSDDITMLGIRYLG